MRRANTRLLIVAGILVLAALAIHFFAGEWLSGLFVAMHGGSR
jgi:hypothetical protein